MGSSSTECGGHTVRVRMSVSAVIVMGTCVHGCRAVTRVTISVEDGGQKAPPRLYLGLTVLVCRWVLLTNRILATAVPLVKAPSTLMHVKGLHTVLTLTMR